MFYKLWATMQKDIRVLLRDRVGIALMFVMPIILVVVVTSIQNSTFQLVSKNKLPILIANNDTGKSSSQMVKAIGDIGMFKVTILSKNEGDIKNGVEHSDAMLGIVIPANFSSKVAAKSKSVSDKAMTSFGLGDSTKKKEAGD